MDSPTTEALQTATNRQQLPSPRLVDAARRAEQRLAGRHTPFLRDCWYVAGFSGEFSRTLLARTILGTPMVLFRAMNGDAVALDERCPHRSFPLSRSFLDRDTIVCGYHGLRFDLGGRCTEMPGSATPPAGVGVRSYPLREAAGLVWIWPGTGEPDAQLPLGDWVSDRAWRHSTGYFSLKANYITLHENLLDLTHLSFLHAQTFGTPDYAVAPYELDIDEAAGHFAVLRTVAPTRLPPIWGEPTGLMGKDAVRTVRSAFLAPSLHVVQAAFRAYGTPATPDEHTARTAHLITPETATTTHYFFVHGRNFAVHDATVTSSMHQQLSAAFQEDVSGLDLVEAMISRTPEDGFFQIALASDRAGMAARRWMFRQLEKRDLPKDGIP